MGKAYQKAMLHDMVIATLVPLMKVALAWKANGTSSVYEEACLQLGNPFPVLEAQVTEVRGTQ